jgi:dihydropteroate synthase
MGVVNVTPDSFSDGGRYLARDAAAAHATELVASGAWIVDVGGESTRPGAASVDAAEECRRVVPVIEAMQAHGLAAIASVDTTKSAVAGAALEAGAAIVNDISGGRHDAEMFAVAADHDAGFVVMHMQGTPATMQDDPQYDDVVREVGDFLLRQLDGARGAGIRDDALLADPGIGFGKTIEHNLALLAALPVLAARIEVPLVVGASRKWFLGQIVAGLPVDERDDATLATTVWAFESGARVVRVHDVESSARTARLLDTLERATPEGIAA